MLGRLTFQTCNRLSNKEKEIFNILKNLTNHFVKKQTLIVFNTRKIYFYLTGYKIQTRLLEELPTMPIYNSIARVRIYTTMS